MRGILVLVLVASAGPVVVSAQGWPVAGVRVTCRSGERFTGVLAAEPDSLVTLRPDRGPGRVVPLSAVRGLAVYDGYGPRYDRGLLFGAVAGAALAAVMVGTGDEGEVGRGTILAYAVPIFGALGAVVGVAVSTMTPQDRWREVSWSHWPRVPAAGHAVRIGFAVPLSAKLPARSLRP